MRSREETVFFHQVFSHIAAQQVGSTPQQFAEHIQSELVRYGKVIKAAKITME